VAKLYEYRRRGWVLPFDLKERSMKSITGAAVVFALLSVAAGPSSSTAPSSPADAVALAEAVMKASGAEVWRKVTRIKFNFAGRNYHDWDVKNMTDTVTSGGKTVTVNLNNPGNGADQKQAFRQWTNDSYWLLMPLKLGDPGVKLKREAPAEIDGTKYEVLHVSFDKVGLTPDDQYLLYVDPQTHLVRHWDYMPSQDRKTRMSWEGYQTVKGLTLSTEHKTPRGSLKITQIEVTTE
jgi:hypothetical protein